MPIFSKLDSIRHKEYLTNLIFAWMIYTSGIQKVTENVEHSASWLCRSFSFSKTTGSAQWLLHKQSLTKREACDGVLLLQYVVSYSLFPVVHIFRKKRQFYFQSDRYMEPNKRCPIYFCTQSLVINIIACKFPTFWKI